MGNHVLKTCLLIFYETNGTHSPPCTFCDIAGNRSIGKSTKLQCNVTKNFGNIATSLFTHNDLVQKWEKSIQNSEKSWFYILRCKYVIKYFLATKSLRNGCLNGRPKTLNLTQSRSLIINLQKNPSECSITDHWLRVINRSHSSAANNQEWALFSQHLWQISTEKTFHLRSESC